MGELSDKVRSRVSEIATLEEISRRVVKSLKADSKQQILQFVMDSMRRRVAFSDQLLLIAWQYSVDLARKKDRKRDKKSPKRFLSPCDLGKGCLWDTIEETLKDILKWETVAKDKRNWHFFDTYLMDSAVLSHGVSLPLFSPGF